MHRRLASAFVAVHALLCACSSSDAEPKTREHGAAAPAVTWRFDEPAGALPAGTRAASGAWGVVADAEAPSAPHVLAQTARGDHMQFHVLFVEREQPADIDLSVSLRDVGGELERGGGLVWRARDDASYYLARYDPHEKDCRIYKVVDGKRQQLASAAVDAAAGWHRLRVRAFRESIECSIDGRVVVSARDRTFPAAGRAGLWTESDAHTQFDDLAIGPNL